MEKTAHDNWHLELQTTQARTCVIKPSQEPESPREQTTGGGETTNKHEQPTKHEHEGGTTTTTRTNRATRTRSSTLPPQRWVDLYAGWQTTTRTQNKTTGQQEREKEGPQWKVTTYNMQARVRTGKTNIIAEVSETPAAPHTPQALSANGSRGEGRARAPKAKTKNKNKKTGSGKNKSALNSPPSTRNSSIHSSQPSSQCVTRAA